MRLPPALFVLGVFLLLWNYGPASIPSILSATVDDLSRVADTLRSGNPNAFDPLRSYAGPRSQPSRFGW